jgi:hypothetical protein
MPPRLSRRVVAGDKAGEWIRKLDAIARGFSK